MSVGSRGLFLGVLAFLLAAMLACSQAAELPPLDVRAQALDRSLICPVCPGETIDQSQATLAGQMQAFVREKLLTGWTDQQIRQYFVDRYGDSVLAAPPKSGFNLIVWVVPPVGVLGGLLLLVLAVRGMRGRREAAEKAEGEGALQPYLALVDRELEGDKANLSTLAPGASANGPGDGSVRGGA